MRNRDQQSSPGLTRQPEPYRTGNARLELLRPLINATRTRLAHKRLLHGEPLVNAKTGAPLFAAADVKVALMILHELHPWEALRREEEAFFRGLSSDTLNRRDDLRPL